MFVAKEFLLQAFDLDPQPLIRSLQLLVPDLELAFLLPQPTNVMVELIIDIFHLEDHPPHTLPVFLQHAMHCPVAFGQQLILQGLDRFLQVLDQIVLLEQLISQALQTLTLLRNLLLLTTHVLRQSRLQ